MCAQAEHVGRSRSGLRMHAVLRESAGLLACLGTPHRARQPRPQPATAGMLPADHTAHASCTPPAADAFPGLRQLRHSTARHSTAQRSTAQHGKAQHSTALTSVLHSMTQVASGRTMGRRSTLRLRARRGRPLLGGSSLLGGRCVLPMRGSEAIDTAHDGEWGSMARADVR